MVILGIDPGTATTGFGLIRTQGKNVEVIDWGLIETDKGGTTGKRLEDIYRQVILVLNKHKPAVMAIEKIFFATNAKTAISVGQAQGVLLFAASTVNVPVFEYAPGSIKKMVAGDGRADKKMVQKSVRVILGKRVRSKAKKRTHFDNAADALAVALCHAIKTNGTMIGGE